MFKKKFSEKETNSTTVPIKMKKNSGSEPKLLVIYDIDPLWDEKDKSESLSTVKVLSDSLTASGRDIELVEINGKNIEEILSPYSPRESIIFNWCENIPGIARSEFLAAQIIENMGFVYTGSTPDVLKLSADKIQTKKNLLKNNITTPEFEVFNNDKTNGWDIFPSIVKSAVEHCSIGITNHAVVTNKKELKKQLRYFLKKHKQPAMVEDFIEGREFHVSLWGDGSIEVLPIAEMDFSAFSDIHDKVCTYGSKFIPTSEHYLKIKTLLPAPLSEDERKNIENFSIQCFRALSCRDYARFDIREREGKLYMLDVNPNPDISPDASMAYAAETIGYSFGKFAAKLLQPAEKRFQNLN